MHNRNSEGLRISVIIPSHFRPSSLVLVLEGLAHQTLPPECFEVIVVLDGGCDESFRMMHEKNWPFQLRAFTQLQSGATTARNRAIREARGNIIVALDDDVIPTSTLLQEHAKGHVGGNPTLVIGTFIRSTQSPEPVTQLACDWSHLHAGLLLQAGTDQNKLASLVADGNLSVPRAELLRIGGWDEAIGGVGGSDDLDLATRWLAAGYRLQPEPRAIGEHYWCKTWSQHLRDQRHIGRAHRYVLQRDPELYSKLDYARITGRSVAHRFLAGIARYAPEVFFTGFCRIIERSGSELRRSYGGLLVAMIRFSGVIFYLRGFSEGYIREQAEAKQI
jgi:glycosyltransferase involved in cell wall biosynthesis